MARVYALMQSSIYIQVASYVSAAFSTHTPSKISTDFLRHCTRTLESKALQCFSRCLDLPCRKWMGC